MLFAHLELICCTFLKGDPFTVDRTEIPPCSGQNVNIQLLAVTVGRHNIIIIIIMDGSCTTQIFPSRKLNALDNPV